MSAFTSSMACAWSGVSSYRKASSISLPRRVGCEGVAGRGETAAVEDDELLGDLAHRRPDTGAGLLPIAAAHAVQRGRLAAGVATHGADLVGGDVELVTGSVLEQQVVALDAADGARHLLVAPDAVLVVHDEVAGLERVVEVGPAAGAARPAVQRRRPVRSASAMTARPAAGDDAALEGATTMPISPGARRGSW